VWTFYAPTQHCVVFILVKETLQMMMSYDDDDDDDCGCSVHTVIFCTHSSVHLTRFHGVTVIMCNIAT